MKWREANGQLQSIEEMLQIDHCNIDLLESFCSNVLENMKSISKKSTNQTSNIVKPRLESEQCNKIKTCVSVHIGVRRICWSRIELNCHCTLTDWQTYDISDKKLHISDLIARCLSVDKMIPEADCYVLETPDPTIQMNPNTGNAEQKNINVEKAQIMAMIGFALANRSNTQIYEDSTQISSPSPANVFYMRQLLFSRFFSNVIGSERVGCEPIIEKMIKDAKYGSLIHKDNETGNENHLHFPHIMQKVFAEASRPQREFLGQCLLLNLAFIRLVLRKDSKSLEAITQPNKRAGRKS